MCIDYNNHRMCARRGNTKEFKFYIYHHRHPYSSFLCMYDTTTTTTRVCFSFFMVFSSFPKYPFTKWMSVRANRRARAKSVYAKCLRVYANFAEVCELFVYYIYLFVRYRHNRDSFHIFVYGWFFHTFFFSSFLFYSLCCRAFMCRIYAHMHTHTLVI